MTTLVTRAGKGSPLTNTEMDGNLTGLIANNSGAVEPTTMYAYQWWADTTSGILKQRNAANNAWINILTMSTGAPLAASLSEQSLTGYYYPSNGSAFQDMYRSGWLPNWFNQQWGGAQMLAPSGSGNTCATLQIQDDDSTSVSQAAGSYYVSTGFKVSETATYDSIELKLTKAGNPTYNITARIYSDTAGSPNAAIGTAATLSCKLITSKADGEWYTFTGLNIALTAGTQYHIVLSSLAAVDASNYLAWHRTGSNKYPHGFRNGGTSVPAWTQVTGSTSCFAVINPAANSIIQSAGMFDYKLAFNPGTPVNQSRSVAQPLANFYDGKTCSVLYRGTFAISTNVWDFTYGLDHDRITLTINSSGYPVLTIYESDRTVATVTGTGSVASGNHDVGIRVRTMADGADYATLYVDGVSVGTPLTAQTFTMAAEMVRLGAARLGDGFGLAPTWTQDMQMTSLPSAQGWIWTGTGTEANCMSVAGDKLYQNANGYTSTQNGYYTKTTAFVNATGWTVKWKSRAVTNVNTNIASFGSQFVQVKDGTVTVTVNVDEYFLTTGTGAAIDFTYQGDFKSQEHVFTLCGKGSDYYLLIDGKLAVDGTGKMTTSAAAANAIFFGDADTTASANADAIWSYVKYYQGGMILPTATTGTCSEFAHWSGDKSALYASLWNSGTPVSVKQLCGVPRNYQFEQVVQREVRRNVTSAATTTSATDAVIAEMEAYVIGSNVMESFYTSTGNNTNGTNNFVSTYADGVMVDKTRFDIFTGFTSTPQTDALPNSQKTVPLGLHKMEARFSTSGGTMTAYAYRNLTVEARS